MENQPLSKVWSKCHLPEELWPEILSRLPVKSLLRFRCVSKPWLSLIKDPDFCRLHLNNFKNNRDETHLLTVESRPIDCVIRCSDTFEINNTDYILTLPPMCHGGYWEIKYPVNGLVLLKKCRRLGSGLVKDIIMVWNPSIRKFRVIPSLPEIETSVDSLFEDAEIGLGYDELGKDYKYVKLIFVDEGIMHSVAIYTLGAGSWKIIQFQGKGFFNWRWDINYIDRENAVYRRGSLYTLAMNEETNVAGLVSIDLSSEVFSCTSLPDDGFISHPESCYSDGELTLVDDGCTLAVLDFSWDDCMWVLEDESMCWTKRYSFDLSVHPRFLYVNKNGDMLTWFGHEKTSFRLVTRNNLVQAWNLVSSYNLETEKEKIMMQRKSGGSIISTVFGYIESLVLLN